MTRSESDPAATTDSRPVKERTPFLSLRISLPSGILFATTGILFAIGMIFTRPLVDATHAVVRWSEKSPRVELPEGMTPDEQLMYGISDLSGEDAAIVLEKVVADNDRRYIPVMLELVRMTDSRNIKRMYIGAGLHRHFNALEKLTGQELSGSLEELGSVTQRWDLWYQANAPIEPPHGFAKWKGHLYRHYDPDYVNFFKDEYPTDISLVEIQHGGDRMRKASSLNSPRTVSAKEATFLTADEPVVGIEHNGVTRAYPQRILDVHEIVNDDLNGMAMTLSSCGLFNSCNAFKTELESGLKLTFGTSGLLHNSNKLMFDQQTRSLWNQLSGQPVVGKMRAQTVELEQIPVTVTKWQDWLQAHPNTEVVSLHSDNKRSYVLGLPFGRYHSRRGTMFPILDRDNRLQKKDFIYGIQSGNAAKAYAINTLIQQPILHDQFDDQKIVILTPHGMINVSANIPRRRGPGTTSVNYRAGAEVRIYESKENRFTAGDGPGLLLDSDGKSWKTTEQALVSESGDKLSRINGTQAYWFGWSAFHPDTELLADQNL